VIVIKRPSIVRQPLLALALAMPLLGLYPAACFPAVPAADGSCQLEPEAVIDCRAPGYGDELLPAGLVGYSCTGSVRPDLDATYVEGVPRGLLCAAQGPLGDTGKQSYCCTDQPVECAYDPVSDCEAPTYGYECWGANRPESLNPALSCTNGNREHDIVDYCCAATSEFSKSAGCQQSDTVGCAQQLLGFLCQDDRLPRGEDLGANKSRANYFHPVCSTPEPAPNPEYKVYCCYMPALVPIGGSCWNHTSVPGCEAGRFGFACYGPDTPEDDYLSVDCPEPGFSGVSAEGYPATLYCCDHRVP
jgi:hypothetical protein